MKCELGSTHQAVKIIRKWTGAGERTVKNWLAGISGPSGQHLVDLIRNSDGVLQVLLIMAGRHQTVAAQHLGDLRNQLMQTVEKNRSADCRGDVTFCPPHRRATDPHCQMSFVIWLAAGTGCCFARSVVVLMIDICGPAFLRGSIWRRWDGCCLFLDCDHAMASKKTLEPKQS